ncbi:Ldh family oxidoreductase [Usitatibacter palustris]|uniref:Putative oxidoreductase YjmC n=1 Tax=Usitatibacter palustris TaxID=2732487 RepID=A0A6M4H9S0_9PROT|nr:Ldh family oxidoreductase [Usitatibacter palustris]QJR14797.1 putative oxidoreductase YjmC [Usitatibacter palustris]
MTVRVLPGRLTAWAVACLEAVGVPPADARLVAESLVQTSLWGVDSHGILRLTHYMTRLSNGSISATAVPLMKRTGTCTAQMDGMDGLGIIHGMRAMNLAMEMAFTSGVGVVGVGDSSHCGALGLYTRPAARKKLIGIAFTHSSSVVAPHGGREPFFGTNPLSIAFPRAVGDPMCLDMATSQVAWNKVLNARIENVPLEPDIAIDATGAPTLDAHAAKAGIPLGGPVYGYKGYGLALMIDLLCGAMNGMTYGPKITSMYEELEKPRKLGHLMIAIDPRRFAGAATLEATIDTMIADLRSRGDILFPGEPELAAETDRRNNGIPIESAALADMHKWSVKLGVEPLQPAAA